ncbi:GNAT family N-acetyltransferase [Neisseria sp. Ec49-e6-T10]|uniref:GNAT family N-acetyltransferase n=1 Tax=Neisseria sp. Ec49-e6-T10 TaxID=3140744 RepID=UPI003EC03AD3
MNQNANRPNLAGIPIYIETNGYLLRSLTPADITEAFLTWMNSTEMMEGLNLPPINFSAQQLSDYIKQFDHKTNYFIGIFDQKNDHLLVGFYTIDINLAHKVGHITAGVGEAAYSGKTVFWATIDALLDHFYFYRDLHKMVARVLSKNKKMLFCFVNNPRFELEAVLKEECLSPTSERVDILLFSSFRPKKT